MATKSISQLDSAVSLALGDLFEIAEPDGQSQTGYASKKISMSQAAKYVQEDVSNASLNTTDKTLVGAINEVDSEGVKWSEYNFLGAKNMLNPNGMERTNLSITSVLKDDGTITSNGTANNGGQLFEYNNCILPNLKVGDVVTFSIEVFSGSYTHGSSTSLTRIYLVDATGNTLNGTVIEMGNSMATGDKKEVDYTITSNCFKDGVCTLWGAQCYARSGDIFSDFNIGIMLRLKAVSDNTFEPYAQTNRQLTINKMDWNNYTEYGVKNLIPFPWSSEAKSGRINRGITFTYDEEGYITLNGTADSTNQPYMCFTLSTDAAAKLGNVLVIEGNRKYTLSIDRTDNRLFAMIYIRNTSGASASVATRAVYEDGTVRELTTDFISLLYSSVFHKEVTFEILTSGSYRLQVDLRVNNNSGSYTNAKGRVILQDAQISDTSWMPYADTNHSLSIKKADMIQIATVETSGTASKAYAIGDYMIWQNGFYKVTAAISQGGAITRNTNVSQTTIGAELTALFAALSS